MFGPYMAPSEMEVRLLANEINGTILGLYYDASTDLPARLNNLGLLCDAQKVDKIGNTPNQDNPQFPSDHGLLDSLHGSIWEKFMSRAVLKNVSRVNNLRSEISMYRHVVDLY